MHMWENTIAMAAPGDFVFLDPPYFSDVATDSVRQQPKYQREVFGLPQHEALAVAMRDLERRGVAFMLTNSAEQEMRDLYRDNGFEVQVVSIPRAINSKGDQRGGVDELVVLPGGESRSDVDTAAVLFDLATRRRTRSAPEL
jgi:DNA adenine methylase